MCTHMRTHRLCTRYIVLVHRTSCTNTCKHTERKAPHIYIYAHIYAGTTQYVGASRPPRARAAESKRSLLARLHCVRLYLEKEAGRC